LFGSFDNLLLALKKNSYLLGANLERVVKPNLSLLSEYGLGAHEISKFCLKAPTLLTVRPARVRAMAAFVEDMGIPCGKLILWHALRCFTNISKESVTAKIELLKRIFRCSEPEVIIVLSKTPALLTNSEDRMCRVSGFLFSEAGLDPAYVACHPELMTYSLEGRLMPRFYVVKFLKETGSLGQHRSYYAAVAVKEKDFVERYIQPYMEAAPHLAEDYAAACRGQGRLVPRFYVVKFLLKEKGLLGHHQSYYAAVLLKEKGFGERYIHPYMEAAPNLAIDYAAACRGSKLRFYDS
ncbi:hypothetical protein EJB05_45591, partial [Eragrostis curvula]